MITIAGFHSHFITGTFLEHFSELMFVEYLLSVKGCADNSVSSLIMQVPGGAATFPVSILQMRTTELRYYYADLPQEEAYI